MSSADNKYRLDDFELYQVARKFRIRAYKLAKLLPSEEKFGLAPQMRRAAVSITNNIAEGHGRWTFQDNARMCRIARGSVDELIDDLNTCIDENYADVQALQQLKEEGYVLINRINGYIAYLKKARSESDD